MRLFARTRKRRPVLEGSTMLLDGEVVQLLIIEHAAERTDLAEALEGAKQEVAAGRAVDEADVFARRKAIA